MNSQIYPLIYPPWKAYFSVLTEFPLNLDAISINFDRLRPNYFLAPILRKNQRGAPVQKKTELKTGGVTLQASFFFKLTLYSEISYVGSSVARRYMCIGIENLV